MYRIPVLLLLTALTLAAQTAPANPSGNAPAQSAPSAQKPSEDKDAKEAAEIAPSTPVITLHGLCPDKPTGTDPASPECETVVTREEFEHLVETLAPSMPASAKQQLAGDYSRMLVLSAEARKRGLDKTARFNDILEFMKMRILSQELLGSVQEKSKPTEADVQKYYQDNQAKYEEVTLKRVFVPRNSPAPADSKAGEPKPKTDAELQAEGEKYRARLAAGEDFDKVQKDAYEAAGFKTPPPPTSIPNWRKESVAPQQQALFDLNKGDLSKVMVEPAGAYIYKIQEKTTAPLSQVKAEIESQLTNQHMQKQMEELTGSVKPEVNQAYFRALSGAGEDREVHALTPPASTQNTAPKPAAKAPSSTKPKTTTPTSKPATTPKK